MKQNSLLGLLMLFCVAVCGIAFTAALYYSGKYNPGQCTHHDAPDGKATRGEVTISQSLYQQLLTFN